jgi:hypothetical protein
MKTKKFDDKYSDEEAQRRFEASLRGARAVGHEPMKDIPPKRSTNRKAKASTKGEPAGKCGQPKKSS